MFYEISKPAATDDLVAARQMMQPSCHAEIRQPTGAQGTPPPADSGGMGTRSTTFALLSLSVGLAGCTTVSVTNPLASIKAHVLPTWISAAAHKRAPSAPVAAVTPPVAKPAPPVPTTEMVAFGFASIAAQSGEDLNQRRLQAALAAKLDAYRSLAEQLYGLDLAGESTVEGGRVRSDNIRARVAGAITGAELVSIEPFGNDSYQATVRLPAARPAITQSATPASSPPPATSGSATSASAPATP